MKANKALIFIPSKYADFTDVFSKDQVAKLSKYIGINNHAIDLLKSQQLVYEPIYSLGPMELETLKTYIKTNLANGFIKPSKFLVNTRILFVQKLDGSLCLCINYQGLKNLTIKNWYILLLIYGFLYWLGWAKGFI